METVASTGSDRLATLAALRAQLDQRFATARLQQLGRDLLPTGVEEVDRLLGGGLPGGALTELSGPLSSGRTTLALRAVAHTQRAGHLVCWIDQPGQFHPPSAQQAGVALERLLVLTPPSRELALAAADQLLRFQAFPLVVLDLASSPGPRRQWARLQTLGARGRAALLVLAPPRPQADPLRAFAAASMELTPGPPARLQLVRARHGGLGRRCTLPLALSGRRFALHPALPG